MSDPNLRLSPFWRWSRFGLVLISPDNPSIRYLQDSDSTRLLESAVQRRLMLATWNYVSQYRSAPTFLSVEFHPFTSNQPKKSQCLALLSAAWTKVENQILNLRWLWSPGVFISFSFPLPAGQARVGISHRRFMRSYAGDPVVDKACWSVKALFDPASVAYRHLDNHWQVTDLSGCQQLFSVQSSVHFALVKVSPPYSVFCCQHHETSSESSRAHTSSHNTAISSPDLH